MVASVEPQGESIIASTRWSTFATTSTNSDSGSSSPGISKVEDKIGSPISSTRLSATTWSGIRTPKVCFFLFNVARGTSLVPLRIKV